MPQAAAVALYNFVTWVGSTVATVSGGAISASTATAATVSAVDAGIKLALLTSANAVIANQNKPEQQGGLVTMTINANEPRRLIIGQRETGGVLVDWQIKGSKNQNLFMVVYLGEGPMGRLMKVRAGGRDVYTSPINHGVRTTIPNFRSGGDRLWVTYYDGRPGQTADSYMQSEFPGTWTSNHRGTGCAYVIVEAQWDSDNLTSPPAMSFVVEGAKLYDRRLDSTAGGSGSHRLTNPATWTLSKNPRVALDHYLLGRYSGSIRTFGIGLDPADVPYAEFAAGANLCDESVPLKAGGSQPRYEANGFLFADRSYKDTIKDLCRAMNARAADHGGRIAILDGVAKTPVMTLTEDDLIEGTVDQYRPKQSWGELISGVQGTYIDARQSYQPVPYPDITNAAWDAEDNGQTKMDVFDLEMETNQERAERLATLYAMLKRRQARLSGTYKFRAIQLEQGDWFIRSGGKFGAGKVFEVIDRSFDPRTLTVSIAAFEVDPNDTAWDEDEAADEADAPSEDASTLPGLGLPDVSITAFSYTVGDFTFPAFRFVNNLAADPVPYGIHIEYAFSDEATTPGPTGEVFTQTMPATMAQAAVYGLFPDKAYVIRLRHFSADTLGDWTEWSEVTTSDAYAAGEAAAMDWANVYGFARPADYADVTGGNISLGFAGQGALATKSTLQYGDAELVGLGTFATLNSINTATANANNLLRYSAGGQFIGDLNADLTSGNISLGFTGQGALATLNALAYGGGYLTGFGSLAGLSSILGLTAGGFTGQGALATLNDVSTGNIQGGAVNGGSATELTNAISVTDSWQVAVSQTVSVPAGASFVKVEWGIFTRSLGTWLNNADSELELRVRRAGSTIFQTVIAVCEGPRIAYYESGGTVSIGSESIIIPGRFKGFVTGWDVDFSPPTGTTTYEISVRRAPGAGSRSQWTISAEKLIVDIRKR
jgi:hypothetical protein